MQIQFHGPLHQAGALVTVDGVDYLVTQAAVDRLSRESNARAWAEAIEYLAHLELDRLRANASLYFKRP